MKKAFKYRIYPTAEQRVFLGKTFGCCRFVWNALLADSIAAYTLHKTTGVVVPNVTSFGLVKRIVDIKTDNPFLSDVSMQALGQKAIDLGKAYTNFFRSSKYPRFKSKRDSQSFRLPTRRFSIRESKLRIEKGPGLIKIKWDKRGIPPNPSQVTITLDRSGRYYASFLCDVAPTRHCGDGSVGIDLGLKDLMTFSTGEHIPNPRHLNHHLRSLARLQRRLSRKVKGSNNRNKQRIRVARLHARISDTRNNHLHQLSTRLINENQVICLETLNVSGMMKNRRLARHIGDVSWGKLVVYLGYKAAEAGAKVILIDPFYASTQTCHACHHRLTGESKLTLRDRSWTCPECQSTHDRDHNAAINILHEGMRVHDSVLPGTVVVV